MNRTVSSSLALCLLIMSSCNGEEERTVSLPIETPVPLQLHFERGEMNLSIKEIHARNLVDETGTGGTNKTDRIGVYATGTDHKPYKGSQGQYIYIAQNATGSSWKCYTGTSETGNTEATLYLSNLTATLQAFHPAGETVTPDTGNGNHTIPVTIPATQTYNGTNTWECSATDYLYASGDENTLTAITVNNQTPHTGSSISQTIYLFHALTKLIFQIKNGNGQEESAYNYVKSITLTAATGTPFLTSTGTMQIKDGTLAGLTPTHTLTFTTTSPVSITSSYTTVGYGLAAPVSSTGNISLSIKLGAENNTNYDRTLSATLPATPWQSGCSCTYQLLLKGHILIPSGITIGTHTDETVDNEPVIDVD